MKRIRLDVKTVELGLFETRERAKASIMAGEILVNGNPVLDSSYGVKDGDEIKLLEKKNPYVSRGGLKLKAAIDYFQISLKGRICLDIGVATGGFSDCMIKEGAEKVYGVDVGKGQLNEKLLSEKRFVFIPETNARFLKPEIFNEKPEFFAVDVSFISLKLIIPPIINCISEKSSGVLLVKPQFELEAKDLKKGIVKSEELRQKALNDIKTFISDMQFFDIVGAIDCPVEGAKGNREFLMYIKRK
ncbi:MAG: TlyA family RNA methyltransferase [Elusimicrobia bacterium]|nr:TlyA family RNA methyltransferase [Elusimicrobiota bacterium]